MPPIIAKPMWTEYPLDTVWVLDAVAPIPFASRSYMRVKHSAKAVEGRTETAVCRKNNEQ